MKRIIVLFMAVMMLASFAACTKKADTANSSSAQNGSSQKNASDVKLPDIVTGSIVLTDLGTLTFELYPNIAPQSALNFIYLAKSGHFNGVIVDRIVKDFCIQAGRYESGFTERKTEQDYTIKGEFSDNGFENNLAMTNGAIAWVTEGDSKDSAHTEFAIYPYASTSWDMAGKAAVFGYITGDESFKILDKINSRKTYQEKPKKEIMIAAVTIDPVTQEGFSADFEFPLPDFIKK